MTKPSSKHLELKEMEQSNKVWFEKFKAETHHESKGYYQTIENFLKYIKYKDKPLNTFTTLDIEGYILDLLENNYLPKTLDGKIATISSFKNFLIKNCAFPQNFLSDVLDLQFNENSVSDDKPLNPFQLHHVREYNKNSIVDEFIFEVYFQLGIDKKDLEICIPQNANLAKRCFYSNGREILYNEKINQLINKVKNTDEFEGKTQNIVYRYLRKVTVHLKGIPGAWEKDRALNYSDIHNSHKVYMLKCPNPSCKEICENIQQNWVLIKEEFDAEYRLVCAQCKGKPYEH